MLRNTDELPEKDSLEETLLEIADSRRFKRSLREWSFIYQAVACVIAAASGGDGGEALNGLDKAYKSLISEIAPFVERLEEEKKEEIHKDVEEFVNSGPLVIKTDHIKEHTSRLDGRIGRLVEEVRKRASEQYRGPGEPKSVRDIQKMSQVRSNKQNKKAPVRKLSRPPADETDKAAPRPLSRDSLGTGRV